MSRPLSNHTVREPEHIEGILRDLIGKWMEGYVRPTDERNLLVRCTVEALVPSFSQSHLALHHMSPEGLERLKVHKSIELEFSDQWTRVRFTTQILEFRTDGLLIKAPQEVQVYERRQFLRYRTALRAEERPQLLHRDGAAALDRGNVLDISVGGLCVETKSKGFVQKFRLQPEGLPLRLQLPDGQLHEIQCQLRWVKPEPKSDEEREITLGLAFHEPPREVLLAIGRYIKSVQGMQARGI